MLFGVSEPMIEQGLGVVSYLRLVLYSSRRSLITSLPEQSRPQSTLLVEAAPRDWCYVLTEVQLKIRN